MAATNTERRVDHSAIKTNQAFIVALVALAFVLNFPLLAGFVALVMLVGTAWPRLALFQEIYRRLLRPLGLVRPHVIVDNPEPHRFAQGMGGVVLALGVMALLAGLPLLGWALALLVAALAALNLFVGFCTGCFIYYQLNRLGVPGFRYGRMRQR